MLRQTALSRHRQSVAALAGRIVPGASAPAGRTSWLTEFDAPRRRLRQADERRTDEADNVRLNVSVGTANQKVGYPARPDALRIEEVLSKYAKGVLRMLVAHKGTKV
jgi:hypothetical protein